MLSSDWTGLLFYFLFFKQFPLFFSESNNISGWTLCDINLFCYNEINIAKCLNMRIYYFFVKYDGLKKMVIKIQSE